MNASTTAATTAHPRPASRRWARIITALALAMVALVKLASPAAADTRRVFHIAPNGTARADGSSWTKAGTLADLPRFVQQAEPGDEVWIRGDAGAYRTKGAVTISAGGSTSKPVVIRGVDAKGTSRATPTFVGTRTAPYRVNGNPGTELFKLLTGADNLEFRNMAFANQGNGAFRVAGKSSPLTISDMRATNVRRFFENNAPTGQPVTISGLNISNVTVKGFSRNVIRLQDNTHNVTIRNVVGDSQRQDRDRFAIGVHLIGTVHNVLLHRVTMRNSHDTVTGPYWNGDGFAAERGTYNLQFVETVAAGNTDAGYDLKSTKTTLLRTVASDNKRNYRFFAQANLIDSVGRNPHKRGGTGSQAQVWAGSNARVRVTDSTFTDRRSNTFVFAVEARAAMTTKNVKVTKARTARTAVVEKNAQLRRL